MPSLSIISRPPLARTAGSARRGVCASHKLVLVGPLARGPAGTRALASGAARPHRRAPPCSLTPALPAGGAGAADQPPTLLLLECDGVVLDAHNDAHRVAFNRAFTTLGHPATTWTPSLYADLLRVGDGTPEGLLAAYYGTVGWPDSLDGESGSPAVRQAWADAVRTAKAAALSVMVAEPGAIPLRAGLLDLVDEAVAGGAVLGLIAATASAPGEKLASAALAGLVR
jgi:hypothetical protein